MQTIKRIAGWVLTGLALVLLMFRGNLGILPFLLVPALVFAWVTGWHANHATKLTTGNEKR